MEAPRTLPVACEGRAGAVQEEMGSEDDFYRSPYRCSAWSNIRDAVADKAAQDLKKSFALYSMIFSDRNSFHPSDVAEMNKTEEGDEDTPEKKELS